MTAEAFGPLPCFELETALRRLVPEYLDIAFDVLFVISMAASLSCIICIPFCTLATLLLMPFSWFLADASLLWRVTRESPLSELSYKVLL